MSGCPGYCSFHTAAAENQKRRGFCHHRCHCYHCCSLLRNLIRLYTILATNSIVLGEHLNSTSTSGIRALMTWLPTLSGLLVSYHMCTFRSTCTTGSHRMKGAASRVYYVYASLQRNLTPNGSNIQFGRLRQEAIYNFTIGSVGHTTGSNMQSVREAICNLTQ